VSLLAGGTVLNLIGPANHLFFRTKIGIPKLKRKLATGYIAWGRKKRFMFLSLCEIFVYSVNAILLEHNVNAITETSIEGKTLLR
jgi:hypothetical protein